MAAFFLWIILFILCWPLALLALVLYPIVWLLTLPLRLLGIAVHGVLGLISAIFLLPVRLLRGPPAICAGWFVSRPGSRGVKPPKTSVFTHLRLRPARFFSHN